MKDNAIPWAADSAIPLRLNIELKARLKSLDLARQVSQELATAYLGVLLQEDTYFHCPTGRLKLRVIEQSQAELIWYSRSNETTPKASQYYLVPSPQPGLLRDALSAALGVRAVVRKRREVFLFHNVRIHLDEVSGLGSFLEFEAVLGPEVDDVRGHEQIEQLKERFSISASDLLADSYGDMLETSLE